MKIVICDDSKKENDSLRAILEAHYESCSVVQFYEGKSLLEYLAGNEPDIILLDVEMPGINGLETARRLREQYPMTGVIFTTAHAHFALEAFSVYAFDFIVKPVNPERLINSIDMISKNSTEVSKYINIRNKGIIFKVKQKDIIYIEKVYNKCIVYTEKFTYTMVTPLKYFERELDPNIFIKTHKAFIVNRNMICRITPRGNLAYDIHFECTEKKAILSRGMNDILKLTKKQE